MRHIFIKPQGAILNLIEQSFDTHTLKLSKNRTNLRLFSPPFHFGSAFMKFMVWIGCLGFIHANVLPGTLSELHALALICHRGGM